MTLMDTPDVQAGECGVVERLDFLGDHGPYPVIERSWVR